MKYTKTKEILNQAVADLTQLIMITRQQHWYMRGPNFLKLHPYLDDVMDELDEQRDLISERLITIDGSPYSSLSEVLKHTKLEDKPGEWGISTKDRFKTIIADYHLTKEAALNEELNYSHYKADTNTWKQYIDGSADIIIKWLKDLYEYT